MDCVKEIESIRSKVKSYITENKINSLVLGVSGGIDSALVAALVEPICKELKISLIGRSLPILTNKQDEIDRAKDIGKSFCTDYQECELGYQYKIIHSSLCHNENMIDLSKIACGNIKARLRMIYLYNLAHQHKGLVLSTDNYTEYLLGFWTLHGDVGDLSPIQNYWKTEVYEMSRQLVKEFTNDSTSENLFKAYTLQRCISAVPTDGLGITNSDLDQIGAESYEQVDIILKRYLSNEDDDSLSNHPVIQRYESSHFKRNNPVFIPRFEV